MSKRVANNLVRGLHMTPFTNMHENLNLQLQRTWKYQSPSYAVMIAIELQKERL
jgi:hypothetical protein